MSDKNKGPWGQYPSGNDGNKQPEEFDELIRKGQDKIRQLFPKGGYNKPNHSGGGIPGGNAGLLGLALGILILVGWLLTGVYTVDAKEEAVVLRFGQYVRTESPGLKYHIPSPIERIVKVRVTERYIDVIDAGGGNSDEQFAYANKGENGLLMLTGDENIVDISFEVQWQIADARKFLFNIRDQRITVRNAAESAMREVIATTPINDILSEDRITAQQQTKLLLQEILDSYDAGVVVKEINMNAVPPRSSITVEVLPSATKLEQVDDLQPKQVTTTVADAFKDVQAAINNKQEKINIARGYANQQIPIARGEVERIILDAQAYKQEVVSRSQGDSARFLAVYEEYRKAKDVTRKRIYLETLEAILPDMDKMVIDKSVGSHAVPYLPLNQANKAR